MEYIRVMDISLGKEFVQFGIEVQVFSPHLLTPQNADILQLLQIPGGKPAARRPQTPRPLDGCGLQGPVE